MLLNSDPWLRFFQQLKGKTGLDLNLYKPDQMRRRIGSMMEAKGAKDLDQFWKIVGASEADLRWFTDKLAINVSELFRNPEKWTEMRDRILPELLKQSKTLKCWSAGCSFGAEAHTLAALFESKFPGNHTILGTDIDASALEQAMRGEFSDADIRNAPADIRTKFFDHEGIWHRAKPCVKKYLKFRKGDLLADRFEAGFDLIMCRNVVIYFTEAAKDDLYKKFFQALKPGGYLFVGSTERIFNSKEIGFESPWPFFYQKPKINIGEKEWRNAS